MNRFMRIMVFFDLPVTTKSERKAAAKFRKFLINDGYYMVQYSVYARICNGPDAVEKHRARAKANIPDNGSIRMLVVTEKQYEAIDILLGNYSVAVEDEPVPQQLSFF